MSEVKIDPTANVNPQAKLGVNVEVGPYAIIGEDVSIGDNSVIMHHAVVDKCAVIGKDCTIYPFASIGTDPQDMTFKGETTFVEIGDNNRIREFATINRGTVKGGGTTRLGDNNFILAYVHIGHDSQVGNNTLFLNGATLAGHVEVEDFVVIGAFSSVHQFVRLGRNAYIGGYTLVHQDILPFAKVSQSRESLDFYGPNSIGMMRNGIGRDSINHVKEIFNVLFRQNLNTTQAAEKLKEEYAHLEETNVFLEFIGKTKRGLLKNFSGGTGGGKSSGD